MHQHDVAVLHRVESLLDAIGHAERPPVDGADIPEHDLLAASVRLVVHAGSFASMGRAIEPGLDTEHVADRLGTIAYLRSRRSWRHEPGMSMAECVIAHRVAGVMNAAYECRR